MGFLQADARAVHVDVVVVALGHVQFAEGRRQVLDDFHALHAAPHAFPVDDGADDDFGAPLAQLLGLQAFLVVEGDDLMAVVQQTPHQRLAGEARSARDQNLHVVLLVIVLSDNGADFSELLPASARPLSARTGA